MRWLAATRAAVRGLIHRRREDEELDEELRFHLEMETDRLVREEKLDVREARRQAALRFGAAETHREEVRSARGLAWVPGLALDFRLGGRMLVRSWGLTVVGVIGMAMAIAVGATFHAATRVVDRPLPVPWGERLVAVEQWDAEVSNQERRLLHDYAVWREEVRTVEELSAFRTVGRNLVGPDGSAEAVRVAEITASGFRAAGVLAQLGRTLLDEDEQDGSPAVVVIGHDVWRTRFASDPGVVGRELRLGGVVHEIVGVMPEAYAFPVNHHFWVPLRLAQPAEPRGGPGAQLFGRLTEGASLAAAQAEFEALGQRMAVSSPATHDQLRPRVMPYSRQLFDDMQGWEIPVTQAILVLLLLVVCANIGVLVYARTVTRTGEIAVRTALGASRRRIVGQLFVESMVLCGVAAAIGLGAAALALSHMNALLDAWGGPGGAGGLPFWLHFRLEPSTVLFVVACTVVAAAAVGVVPALKVAGERLQASLRQLGGGTGLQLGGTWTALIVAQVAFTVAFLPAAVSAGWKSLLHATADPGFSASEYVAALVVVGGGADTDADPAATAMRHARVLRELQLRLQVEPGVSAATWALDVPGQEPTVMVEVDGVPGPDGAAGHAVRFASVDEGFFDAFNVPVLSGRSLHRSDAAEAATAVVVNAGFVRDVLGGGDALGRQFRYTRGYRSGGVERTPAGVDPARWYQVVGVVPDFPRAIDPDEVVARVYHALPDQQTSVGFPAVVLLVRGGPSPESIAMRLRRVAAAVDPSLQLRNVRSLDAALRETQGALRMAALVLAFVMCSVLLLSAAGIYALMSFTVARRRREIGIRSALGADPHRILTSIFSRALVQLGAGVAIGLALAGLLQVATKGEMIGIGMLAVLPIVAAVMIAVGMLAALGPARQGLRIHPTEALRAE